MVARKRPVVDNTERDNRVLQLFLAGATYRQIAASVGCPATEVNKIVCAEIQNSVDRRTVLADNATAVNQERTEALFRAHWGGALSGDHKSAEICRRILERQLLTAHETTKVEGDTVDEIAARRAARRAGTTSRSARTRRTS